MCVRVSGSSPSTSLNRGSSSGGVTRRAPAAGEPRPRETFAAYRSAAAILCSSRDPLLPRDPFGEEAPCEEAPPPSLPMRLRLTGIEIAWPIEEAVPGPEEVWSIASSRTGIESDFASPCPVEGGRAEEERGERDAWLRAAGLGCEWQKQVSHLRRGG